MTAGLLAAGVSPTAPVRRYPYRAPARRSRAGAAELEPVWLPDAARRTVACFSASGGGKSLLLGRFLAWQDFRRGLPVVVFDPKGQTIDYFLDKIACLDDLDEKAALWRRVRYVNLNGQDGRVTPFPVLAAMRPTEPFAAIAQRFVDVVINSDPYLKTASVQGENALAEVGLAVGIVLAGLGLGISEAWSLLCERGDWDARLAQVAAAYPETAEAVAHVRVLRGLSRAISAVRWSRFGPSWRCFASPPTSRPASVSSAPASPGSRSSTPARPCCWTSGRSAGEPNGGATCGSMSPS